MKLYTLDGKQIKHTGELYIRFTGIAEYDCGETWWFLFSRPHRVDGPAIESKSGIKRWFIFGQEFTEEAHNKLYLSEFYV